MHINVAIICDDWEAGANAYALLQRAVHQADDTGLGRVWLCHLDELALSATAGTALDRAVGMHLILLALSRQSNPPPGLLAWLANWAARREVQDAALALLADGAGTTPSATATMELSEFARRNGIYLILRDMEPSEKGATAPALRTPQKDPVTGPGHPGPTDFNARRSYRCFGINE